MFNFLKRIPTDRIYSMYRDFNDNVYVYKDRTYLLVQKDNRSVRLFDLNSYQTYECTTARFDKLVAKDQMTHCRYALISTFDRKHRPADPFFISAANDLGKIYDELSKTLEHFKDRSLIFDSCYIQDVKTGKFLFIGNLQTDAAKAILQFKSQQETFKPTPIEINQAVEGAAKNNTADTNQKISRKL